MRYTLVENTRHREFKSIGNQFDIVRNFFLFSKITSKSLPNKDNYIATLFAPLQEV